MLVLGGVEQLAQDAVVQVDDWPDLIVRLGIAVMNADAAKDVWRASRDEHASAET